MASLPKQKSFYVEVYANFCDASSDLNFHHILWTYEDLGTKDKWLYAGVYDNFLGASYSNCHHSLLIKGVIV